MGKITEEPQSKNQGTRRKREGWKRLKHFTQNFCSRENIDVQKREKQNQSQGDELGSSRMR